MPPKKKPEKKKEADEGPSYNVAIMNLSQLKQYARLLEGEIEDMRKHCNFYNKMEDELVALLKTTQEDLKYNEDKILSKDVELERLKLKIIKHIKEKEEWPEYMKHRSSVEVEKLSNETLNRLEEEETRHLQETQRLKQVLEEKDREMEALRVKIEMTRRETLEKNEEYLKSTGAQQKNLLELAIRKFDETIQEGQREFKEAKEAMEYEAREDKIRKERSFNNTCNSFKQKLHDYYKEVTRQDLDTIKKLKQEIKKVQENIGNSKVLLQRAQDEHKALKEVAEERLPKSVSTEPKHYATKALQFIEALHMHKKTEKLARENQKLEEQISDVMQKTLNLRRQFMQALLKVRESAETKARILETKLSSVMKTNRNESKSKSVGSKTVKSRLSYLPELDETSSDLTDSQ